MKIMRIFFANHILNTFLIEVHSFVVIFFPAKQYTYISTNFFKGNFITTVYVLTSPFRLSKLALLQAHSSLYMVMLKGEIFRF